MLNQDEIRDLFAQNYHCSQVVFMEVAEELGIDRDEAARLAAPLGGGMFRGDTCGGVTGSLMAIGLAFGDDVELMKQKVAEFQTAFTERCGSTICRELLGYDLSKPGEREKARESGKMVDVCAVVVRAASEILREMLRDVD